MLEGSDVVVLCADVRSPVAHIPPSLVDDVVRIRGKPLIIVVTKVELVSRERAKRVAVYLSRAFPAASAVMPFSMYPGGANSPSGRVVDDSAIWDAACDDDGGKGGASSRRKRFKKARAGRKRYAGAIEGLVEALLSRATSLSRGQGVRRGDGSIIDDRVRVGLIGHPNVGKTSLLNAIVGRVVASASRTAGRTKHMQHIVLERACELSVDDAANDSRISSLRRACVVMDCPGIVFASRQPRHVSEVHGFVPVAQIRETVSAVRYLAECIDLPRAYGLSFPDWTDQDDQGYFGGGEHPEAPKKRSTLALAPSPCA